MAYFQDLRILKRKAFHPGNHSEYSYSFTYPLRHEFCFWYSSPSMWRKLLKYPAENCGIKLTIFLTWIYKEIISFFNETAVLGNLPTAASRNNRLPVLKIRSVRC